MKTMHFQSQEIDNPRFSSDCLMWNKDYFQRCFAVNYFSNIFSIGLRAKIIWRLISKPRYFYLEYFVIDPSWLFQAFGQCI
jgi:hypothetical protein